MGWTVRGPLTEHFCAGSCPGSSSSFSFPAARKQMWDTRHPAGPGSFLHYDIAVQACGGCVHRGVAAVFCSVIDALRNLGFIIQQMLLSIIIMRQRTLRGSETWGLCCRTAAVGQLRGSGAGWEGSARSSCLLAAAGMEQDPNHRAWAKLHPTKSCGLHKLHFLMKMNNFA